MLKQLVALSFCVPLAAAQPPNESKPLPEPVTISNQLGFVIQKGTEGSGLTVVREGKSWAIQDGQATIANDKLNKPGLEPNLRIDRFALGKDTALVKVLMTPTKRTKEFVDKMETVDAKAPISLVDTNGTKYPAIGFIFRDSTKTTVRFTLGAPLKGMSEAPSVTRNTPDRELTLLFIVNAGVDLKEFKIGKVVVEDWTEKLKHVEAGKGK